MLKLKKYQNLDESHFYSPEPPGNAVQHVKVEINEIFNLGLVT